MKMYLANIQQSLYFYDLYLYLFRKMKLKYKNI